MSSRRLLPYKDAIVNLYKHVGNEPFYTQDVAHIFPSPAYCTPFLESSRGEMEGQAHLFRGG